MSQDDKSNKSKSDNQGFYRQIVQDAFLGIAVFDAATGACSYFNQIAKEVLEVKDDKSPGDFNISHFFYNSSKEGFKSFGESTLQQEGFYQDVLTTKTTGTYFIADIGVKKISSDDKNSIVLLFRDMTLQKKLQREILNKQVEIQNTLNELQIQNNQLKALDKAKDRFIALTTHELKTPLSAMIATAEVLKLGFYDSEKQMKEFIETIFVEGMHLLEIVNDILDFSKIQAGKMDFYIEQNQISEIVSKVTDNFKKMAENKSVTIVYHKPEIEPLCYFDPLRLRQITSNILNNAVKFTKEGTTVNIKVSTSDDFVQLMIIDEGPGIPDSHRDRVFNEFETVGNVNTHHKGTGLGMPISKRLIEFMGGNINFECPTSGGTIFTVQIPKNKVLDDEHYRPRPDFASEVA